MRKRTRAGLIALGLALGVGLPLSTPGYAGATTPTPDQYTVVLWSVPAGADPLTTDQPFIASTPGTDLDALDGQMECGYTYQVDVYRSVDEHGTPVSSLWADGALHPNHDGGFLAYDQLPTPYKVVTTEPCAPTPLPVKVSPTVTITPDTCEPTPKVVTWTIPDGLSVGGVTGSGRAALEEAAIIHGAIGGTDTPGEARTWVLPVVVLDGYTYAGPSTITLTQEKTKPCPTEPPAPTPTPEPTPTPTPEPEPTPTDTPSPVPSTEPTPTAGTTPPPSSGAPSATPTPAPTTPSSPLPTSSASAVPVADDTTRTGTLAYTGSSGTVAAGFVALGLLAVGALILALRVAAWRRTRLDERRNGG